MNFDSVQVSIDANNTIVARLLSYIPQKDNDAAEIEWSFFNSHSNEPMDDIYPLFKPNVHRTVEKNLWTQLKQRFDSDFKAAYKEWRRDVATMAVN